MQAWGSGVVPTTHEKWVSHFLHDVAPPAFPTSSIYPTFTPLSLTCQTPVKSFSWCTCLVHLRLPVDCCLQPVASLASSLKAHLGIALVSSLDLPVRRIGRLLQRASFLLKPASKARLAASCCPPLRRHRLYFCLTQRADSFSLHLPHTETGRFSL